MTPVDRLLAATAEVPTPALVVDRAAVGRNVARARDALAGTGIRLRPHLKAHKTTALLRLQLAGRDAAGVTCATAWEAEVAARAGVHEDLLVANEVADPAGLRSLVRAAQAGARVTVAVDHPRHVELLADAATAAGVGFDVLVEVDVGQGRCGLPPGGDDVLDLARRVETTPGLRLRGLQGYEGHAVLLPDRAERERAAGSAAGLLRAERARLAEHGLRCELVSGGGTGTLDLAAAGAALDEVQAGSYVLMDASYARLALPFEHALFCRTTVISRRGDRAVLDAGLKALSAEYGMPGATDPAIAVRTLADEHATAHVPADHPLDVGDAVLLVPAHVDPTVNLHAALHAVAEDGSVEVWAVDARRP